MLNDKLHFVKMLLYSTWWCCRTSGGWLRAKPSHLAHLQPKQAQEDLPHPAFRPQVDPSQHHGKLHLNPRRRSPTGKDPSYPQDPTQATVSTTNTRWERSHCTAKCCSHVSNTTWWASVSFLLSFTSFSFLMGLHPLTTMGVIQENCHFRCLNYFYWLTYCLYIIVQY